MEIQKTPTKLKGKHQYIDFQNGEKLTRKEAMLAHCYQCMGEYQDGKQDCCGHSCPLYQFYPYRPKN